MPSKMQFYAQMADQAAKQITGSYQSWISFLQTAGRLYKYPYNEQVMIHAQRPDATACAEYDFWNRQWGRYVRRGSKGIALIDTSGENPRLRYVFDVADTLIFHSLSKSGATEKTKNLRKSVKKHKKDWKTGRFPVRLAETVGFEPTDGCPSTDFESVPL